MMPYHLRIGSGTAQDPRSSGMMYVLSLIVAVACIHASLAAYCHRHDFDCYGHDIHHFIGNTAACQNACDQNINCKSIQSLNNKCWLKDHACQNHELRPYLTANDYVKHNGPCDDYDRPVHKYCHRPGKDCWGYDIFYIHGTSGPSHCQRLCDFQPTCRSIQILNDGRCWLKYNVCTDAQLNTLAIGHDYTKTDLHHNCAVQGYCHRPNFDCFGYDIRHFHGDTSACKQACNQDPNCKSIQSLFNNCWLKRHACHNHELRPFRYANDYVKHSGACDDADRPDDFKYCHRPGKDCWGHDIVHVAGTSGFAQCQLFCDFQRDCKSIQIMNDGRCWLKRHRCTDPELGNLNGGNDYYKILKSESC